MTVLIVDDEAHVVEAVQLLVPWQKYGIDKICTAFSVPEALDLLEAAQPDIVIVDVIIGECLGIEILKYIQTQHMKTGSIVISGHDDFQYTRAMFLLGAVDYLLKPIVPEELESAVAKAVQAVREHQEDSPDSFEVDKQFKHLYPDHQHSLFRKLFRREMRQVAYEELCRSNSRVVSARQCIVLHVSGMFMPIYSQDYVIALSLFLNNLQYDLEKRQCGTLFQRGHPDPDVVILLYDQLDTALSMVQGACQAFQTESGFPFRLGASTRMPFVDGIDDAWTLAIEASDGIEWSFRGVLQSWYREIPVSTYQYDYRSARAICSALLAGDREGFDTDFAAWLDALLKEQPHTLGTMRNLRKAFGNLIEQDCKGCGFETEGLSIQFSEFCSADWETTIRQISEELRCRLWSLRTARTEEKNWIRGVAEYLEMNYAQKFSQQKCAELFHVNKDYMSRRFREEYGIGMISYLTQIRLKKAKELLGSSDMQIQEIADRVGFFDVKYFSAQFKKGTGMTPSAFRTLGSGKKE